MWSLQKKTTLNSSYNEGDKTIKLPNGIIVRYENDKLEESYDDGKSWVPVDINKLAFPLLESKAFTRPEVDELFEDREV